MISLDMDGTLVESQFINLIWDEGVPRLYAQKHGLSLEAAKELVQREFDSVGEGRVEWYDLKYWFRRFNFDHSWRELLYQFKDTIKAYPEVPDVLSRLSRAYPLVLTSNATREFIDVEMEVLGFRGYFSRIFSATSDFGLVKKTPHFYSLVCRLLGVRPEQLIHIGDHWEFDFLVPRSLGIIAFYLDRAGRKQEQFVLRDLTELEEKLSR
jgi:putative hydrolase of the HAD superfamily